MDKDVERVLLSQLEIQKQKLRDEINELEKQINNNMSEQKPNNPYEGRKLNTDKVVHKTLVGATLEELDTLISEALNDGCQPAGPIFQCQNGNYAMPTVKVPRSMMPQSR